MWNPSTQFLSDMIYKQVQVITEDKSDHVGFVYTVDPVSYTIALIDFSVNGSPSNVRLLPGCSIIDVKILDGECDESQKAAMNRLFDHASTSNEDKKSISDRKARIKGWLIKNRIPVEENEESIRVFDVLEIRRPFGIDSCLCTNEVILARVRKLLEAMPTDF